MLTQDQFDKQMTYAQTQKSLVDATNQHYWTGYMRGLRRSFHGDNFGTPEDHQTYWGFFESLDPDRKQLGTGYRDGFKFNKKRGRPNAGSIKLDPIWIPPLLNRKMQNAAKKKKMTMTDFRRLCYNDVSEAILGIVTKEK